MKRALIYFCIFILSALIFGCNSGSTASKKIDIPPMPDFASLEKTVSENLNRGPLEQFTEKDLKEKIDSVSTTLTACEKAEKAEDCETKTESNLNLMLGDLYFILKDFKTSAKHYQKGVKLRNIIVKYHHEQYEKYIKINELERKNKGNSPLLVIGQHFLESNFAVTFYSEFAEITRLQRRWGEAIKESGDNDLAHFLIAEAQASLQKTMEYLKKYETSKRELLKQQTTFDGDFSNYDAYIKKWDKMLIINKI